MASSKVKHVVVDSGAFIRNAPLRDIGEKIYTIQQVVDEIRDKATKQRLQVLPYDIAFKEPSPDSLKVVTDFSKRTGDYASLSAVDLRVLALTYQLEKEVVGSKHIKTEPNRDITWFASKKSLENPTQICGFYLKPNKSSSRTTSTCSSCPREDAHLNSDTNPQQTVTDNTTVNTPTLDTTECTENSKDTCDKTNEPATSTSNKDSCFLQEGDTIPENELEEEENSEEEEMEEGEEESDDDEGWITPSNIRDVKMSMGDKNVEKADVPVGCVTTDFSMQNVLIQMGLNVVSVDGMLIKRAKNYVLRCYACNKITTNMMRAFCHHCGNKTLQRVSMTVDEDGSIRYFLSTRKPVSTRGLKYSLPTPRGGKHASNPILVEDQSSPHQRLTRASKVKYDVMDPDFIVKQSPFAPNDINSRAFQLGVKQQGNRFRNKRNPNENKKVYGRRK